tara:strand:- start:101 stop:490 length:390 start_codon:yes stop_codon:yes gene_type:complete
MMRLLFVFFILLIINFNANSSEYEWHKIIATKEGNIFFVDMNSIKKKGDIVFFTKLHEYSEVNEFGEKSSIIHHKADCKQMRLKYLKDFYFKLSMGSGNPSFIGEEDSDWIKIKEKSISSNLVKFICNY